MAGFDADFEIEILAACVGDHDYRQRVSRVIRDVDPWTNPAHSELWKVVDALREGDRLTGGVVAHAVSTIRDDDAAEELADAGRIVLRHAPRASGYAAEKLREWVRDHRLKRGLSEAIKHLGDGDYERVDEALLELSRGSAQTSVPWEGGDWWDGFDDRMARRLAEADDPSLAPRVSTRLLSLDRVLNGGLRTTKVGLVVGHTGRGKSAITLNFAFSSAATGNLTAYISTEMNRALVDTRFDAKCFGYSSRDLDAGRVSATDLEEFDARRARLSSRLERNLFTYSVPPKVLHLSMLRDIVDEIEQKAGRKLTTLICDSPDHMIPVRRMRDFRLEQAQVYWDIKQITEEMHLATWATVQASKEYMNKLVTAEGTSESYDKARIADVILTLNQTDAEARDSIVRMFVAKNRSGERGEIVYLLTDFARMHIEETTAPAPPPSPSSGGST